jgi:hypothetical protein
VLESTLRELVASSLAVSPTEPAVPAVSSRDPGRPAVLPAAVLWTGLLVGILRGFSSQREIWQLLCVHGLWESPHFPITDAAFYQRLARTPATALQTLFVQVTQALQARFAYHTVGAALAGRPLAAFAAGIFAFDHTHLAGVARRLRALRDVPAGDDRLLPGALGACFDLRRQQWTKALFTTQTTGNLARTHAPLPASEPAGETVAAAGTGGAPVGGDATAGALLAGLPVGSLILADLGFFSFAWFDQLSTAGYWFVSRLRERVTYVTCHVLYHGTAAGVTVRDSLIYLGKHRADRAGQPVRLVEITLGQQHYTYLTNVLDPRQLPVWEVQELYRRRWNIEQVFDLLKTHLGLHLLWSASLPVVQQQVFATLIIAQIVLALRTEVATAAGADVREVSLPLLVRWLPRLATMGRDPLAEFIAAGRRAGYIRPFRGKQWVVPEIAAEHYTVPEAPPPPRPPRYGSRDYHRRKCAETGLSRRQRCKAVRQTVI